MSASSADRQSMPDIIDVETGIATIAKQGAFDAEMSKLRGSGGIGSGNSGHNSFGHTGLRILMKELSYHVASNTHRGERAYLLKDISAFLEPGNMTALMGPSGSGKTTLLDLLAGRKTVGKMEGYLSFGGSQPTRQFLRRYTGYVEQFDTLLGDLTVREMLTYTAELKRPMEEPLEDKKREVDLLLRRLALSNCADTKIGDPLAKGISGGQAKRTNIGIALISNPRVLFLDEPTSGLDSFTANEVMKVVHGLIADGTTIAATIHSPTAATFALFDQVMLLVRGQLVYFGPQGLPALHFAASEWPAATAASELLEIHRRAEAAAGERSGGNGGGGALVAAGLAFNDAEVLVEMVTAADQRGDAGMLAVAYNKSRLRKENDRQLELYMAEAAGGRTQATANRPCVPGSVVIVLEDSSGNKDVEAISSSAWTLSTAAAKTQASSTAFKEDPTLASSTTTAATSKTTAAFATADPTQPSPFSTSLADKVSQELATRSETVTPWYWGLRTLIKYRSGHNYRNPAWLGPRIADKLLISLIILTLYLGVGDNLAPANLMNITASLFMWALLPAFGAASYVPAIVLERRLFIRERADGLYQVFTYLAAKLLEELLLSLIMTLVFSIYVFYGLQLRGAWVVFWLVYFVDLSVGVVLAYLIAALSPNMDVANAALPAFVVTMLFFAGQLITLDSIPDWWQWYSRIDFLRYAWGALMLNQFENHNANFAGDVPILKYYGLQGGDKWAYIGYLALFWLAFTIMALLALTFVRHQKR